MEGARGARRARRPGARARDGRGARHAMREARDHAQAHRRPCARSGRCSRASSSAPAAAPTACSRRRAFAWPTTFSRCARRAARCRRNSRHGGAPSRAADAEARKAMLLPDTGPKKRRRRRRKKGPSAAASARGGVTSRLRRPRLPTSSDPRRAGAAGASSSSTGCRRRASCAARRSTASHRSATPTSPNSSTPWPSSRPALPPEGLLGELQAIEARHGRVRSFANAPRTLDLDLLLFGESVADHARADFAASAHARARLRADAARWRSPRMRTSRAAARRPGCWRAAGTSTCRGWRDAGVAARGGGGVAACLERLHDLRLVCAPQEPHRLAVVGRRARELGHRPFRVPAAGPGQPHRLHRVVARAAQDHAGGDYPGGIRAVRHLLHEAAAQARLPVGIAVHHGRRCISSSVDKLPLPRGGRADRRRQDQPRAPARHAPREPSCCSSSRRRTRSSRASTRTWRATRCRPSFSSCSSARACSSRSRSPTCSSRPVVADFLLDKDPLFARLTLSGDELALYQKIYESLRPQAPAPDLVVYLQAQPAVLVERVRQRAAGFERGISEEYLALLAESYARFFYHYSAAPLLIVNSRESQLRRARRRLRAAGLAHARHEEPARVLQPRLMSIVRDIDCAARRGARAAAACVRADHGQACTPGTFRWCAWRSGTRRRWRVSIFVNRLQFPPGEDFERYPRTFERDRRAARDRGRGAPVRARRARALPASRRRSRCSRARSAPSSRGASGRASSTAWPRWCSSSSTACSPRVAVFGKKDYQQLCHRARAWCASSICRSRSWPARPCARADGLAMSSRNAYLSPAQRAEAPRLHRVLVEVASRPQPTRRAGHGAAVAGGLEAGLRGGAAAARTLRCPTLRKASWWCSAAARLGETRLIDNLEF